MTFVLKHRFQPGAPMVCEYQCSEHGRFEQLVRRDDHGDPPTEVVCEGPLADGSDCPAMASLCISSPMVANLTRAWTPINPPGAVMHEKDGDPRALKTEDLATGKITRAEWRKRQKDDRMRRWHEKKIKLGLAERKIQV